MVPSAPLAVARAGAPVRRRRAAPAAPAAALSRPAGRRASGPLACTCSLGSAGGPPAPRRAAPRPPAAIAPPPPGVAPAPPSPSNGAAAPDALPIVLPEDLVVAPGVVVPVKRDNTAPACDFNGYLRKILTARVYELAVRAPLANPHSWLFAPPDAPRAGDSQVETPLELAPRLSERLGNGNSVLLKREDMQPVFSFKARFFRSLLLCPLFLRQHLTRRSAPAAAGRVQPHRAAVAGDACGGRGHRFGGQPRAGRGSLGAAAGRVCRGVHAGHHAGHQG